MRKNAIRIMAALTTLSLAAPVMLQPQIAVAGPDDGKFVVTGRHVDSPKAYYDTATEKLELRVGYGEGETADIDQSVLWIGKGWYRGKPQYQFTVPENDLFAYADLRPGATYYTAPAVSSRPHDPIWWGYGAGDGLPFDHFVDQEAALDLVSVDGPGQVELFNFWDAYPVGLSKMLGSGAKSNRSNVLVTGSHTHNYTLFTRPGRHKITYRISGRTTDGEFKTTPLQTLVVQVGGKSPDESVKNPVPLQERYNQAPIGDLTTAGYEFSLAPYEGTDGGDEHLTNLVFNAADKNLNGTLTILIEGYHLTDLPVTNGHAEWPELIGPEATKLQAIFTPNDQNGARWIAEPLVHELDDAGKVVPVSVTSASGEAEIMAEQPNPKNVSLNLEEYQPAKDVTITPSLEQLPDEFVRLRFTADDPNYRGYITVKTFDNADSDDANDLGMIMMEHGTATMTLYNDDLEGQYIEVGVRPNPAVHTDKGVSPTRERITLTEQEDGSEALMPQTLPSILLKTKATAPAPSASNTEETKPSDEPRSCEKAVLSSGHTDLKITGDASQLSMVLKDETGTISNTFVDRKLSDVVNVVVPSARTKRTSRYDNQGLNFLDPKYLTDGHFWRLPETLAGQTNILWPGYNTQSLDMSQFSEGIKLDLQPVKIPEGAAFGLYKDATLHENAKVLIDSTVGDTTIDIDNASHVHTNWIFTRPGVYTFNAVASATVAATGKTIRTEPETLTFVVGSPADKACELVASEVVTPPAQPDSSHRWGAYVGAILGSLLAIMIAVLETLRIPSVMAFLKRVKR
ncbi:choice-of-anchor M domain-containing protein [Corynebacterium sp. HS2168-gen11]|uniref:choice-of-anchor M domain-containing protein n=1 Tax=Corynebacterium sp. HS2168-gen11 TaxID=2974027 RepID=UPI00216B4389|nr:choice-of-anchor M domain-containing protein [Corynebacterium sp. HS2168-gen11]MCS4535016.1 choice-of-anchor M domain-containing protein [Corynebacterium sp. HS2168-gen11]